MKSSLLIGILVLSVIFGCAPKKNVVVTEEIIPVKEIVAEKLEITAEVIAEGKSLYGMNCAKCHELFDANKFTAEEWKPIVLRMQKQAKISDEQREKIYAYLTTPQF